MIWVVRPDPDTDFLPIPDPGSRGQKGTESRIRIGNTAIFIAFYVIGTSLWGPKKVGSLRFSAITVLPIYVHALHTGHQLVMHEVALQMESLVLRQVN
jgi:hypothetical protein